MTEPKLDKEALRNPKDALRRTETSESTGFAAVPERYEVRTGEAQARKAPDALAQLPLNALLYHVLFGSQATHG